MRVLVQVVKNADVTINEEKVSAIEKGVLYLVGFQVGDSQELVNKMITKLLKLRIFPDENGKTNLDLKQVNGSILSVSQFTLYADVKGGNRPSFVRSMPAEASQKLYEYFNESIKRLGYDIKTGVFGADMKVNLVNDGPFTLMLDSDEIYG
jgi:D-tyrosyl-tRNA(Tyr) deacylase